MSQKTFEQLCEDSGDRFVTDCPKYSGYPEHILTYKSGIQFAIDNIDKHPRVAKLIEALEQTRKPLEWFSADYPNDGMHTRLAFESVACVREALAEFNKGKAE